MDSEDPSANSGALVLKTEEPEHQTEDVGARNRLTVATGRVMNAFQIVKGRMDPEAVEETRQYLADLKWVKDCVNPSSHPCYKKIKRRGTAGSPENYYYPHLLVLQAIWPENRTVRLVATAFGKYWDNADMKNGPAFYPILNDKDRELSLFRGEVLDIGIQSGEYDPDRDPDYRPRNKGPAPAYFDDESEDDEEVDIDQEEEEDGDAGDGDEGEATDNDPMDSEGKINDKDENAFDRVAEDLRARLQSVEEKKRKMQEWKSDYWKTKSQNYEKSSEEHKKKSEDDKAKAERYAKIASEYAKRRDKTSAVSNSIPSASVDEESGDGPPAKRARNDESVATEETA
ncbi:hypothetical protein FSARC_3481 [Fusarium sarcochroum]|uniref:Uncharacterized protein n=1 Tax=Fusarium sarcochroum TaxID=1208366 RepID=A0A8H4XBP5_9HYPO|nr:hypothetical protein FSARC_3481 [Fusarium sarcochroum]